MSDSDNFYETLQVDPSADAEVIEEAYKRLVRKFHPDVNQSDEAEETTKQLNAAYEVLRDPDKRATYDRERTNLGGIAIDDAGQAAAETKGARPTVAPRKAAKAPPEAAATGRTWRFWLGLLGGGGVVVAAIILVVLSSGNTPRGTEWYRGSNLVMRVTDLQRVDEVRFASGDKHYVIRPREEGRVLAAVKMELQNSEGNIAFLSIQEDSVTLRDVDQEDYTAINYLERQVEVQESHPEENAFSPFIWGEVELPGRCGEPLQTCQLVGWLIFEVPEGLDPLLVLWEAADTIYIRF